MGGMTTARSKSLAELRSSTRTALPERSYSLCLSQSIVAEVQALEEERTELRASMPGQDDTGPRRQGQGLPPRLAEIDARMAELYEEMREHTGELRLRGVTAGQWARWRDANPARIEGNHPDGRPIINAIDSEVGYGYVNATALLASLGDYAVAYNGDQLASGDWDFIAERAAAGDLKELCKLVVQLHEGAGLRAPKLQPPSSATTPGESA